MDYLDSITKSTVAYGYTISFEPLMEPQITPEIQEELEDIFHRLNKPKQNFNKLIADIKQLAWKYPNVVQFKNYLFVALSQNNQHLLANEVNEQILRQFPDYLFAKLNRAAECIRKKEYDKFWAALEDAKDLPDLAPGRDVFHFSEVF